MFCNERQTCLGGANSTLIRTKCQAPLTVQIKHQCLLVSLRVHFYIKVKPQHSRNTVTTKAPETENEQVNENGGENNAHYCAPHRSSEEQQGVSGSLYPTILACTCIPACYDPEGHRTHRDTHGRLLFQGPLAGAPDGANEKERLLSWVTGYQQRDVSTKQRCLHRTLHPRRKRKV